ANLHTVSAAICWSLSGKSREVLPLPRLRDSKGGGCLRAASPLSDTALTELTVSAPFFAWHGQVPHASAQAFDEARELFLSQMKIVSYYLYVRPIAKKVSNEGP